MSNEINNSMLISASKSEKYYQKCIFFVAILCPSKKCCTFAPRLRENATNAAIAQLVERNLAKVEVAGSNPVCRSFYWNKKVLKA